MRLFVREYLFSHSLRELKENHGIDHRFNKLGDKISLNYNQILVTPGDKLADQCRGLIIRPRNNIAQNLDKDNRDPDLIPGEIDVLAWPINRFYNHGDPVAHLVNWSCDDLQVFEKLDGTMCILHWDPLHSQWFVATRSVPEADLPIDTDDLTLSGKTFSDLFFKAAHATLCDLHGFDEGVEAWFEMLHKDYTYVFELTTPWNRIIVKYDKPRITLLAVRHTESGVEFDIRKAKELSRGPMPSCPDTWASLNEPQALIKFVNEADPSKLEGAVAMDKNYNRIKIKNMAWVLSSKAKDMVTSSRRNAIVAIMNQTVDDIIPLIDDETAQKLNDLRVGLLSYLFDVDVKFQKWKRESDGDRKMFAKLVLTSDDWATPYFQLLDGKGTDALNWATEQATQNKFTRAALDELLKRSGQ